MDSVFITSVQKDKSSDSEEDKLSRRDRWFNFNFASSNVSSVEKLPLFLSIRQNDFFFVCVV